MNVRILPILALPLAALLFVCGCNTKTKPTPKNFQNALNTYFSTHNTCLYPQSLRFPYEVSTTDKLSKEAAGLDALTEATLLKRTEDKSIHVKRYTLTPLAERATTRFCYGHRTVTSIDSFTPPAKQNEFLETSVTYHCILQDVPVWARTEAMRKAFPKLDEELNGTATANTTLAQTMTGWQVPE